MKSYIVLGNINKNILFAIIGGVFKLIAEYILFRVKGKIGGHPFILGLNAGLGMLLSFFPFLCEKIRSRRLNNNINKKMKKKMRPKDPYIVNFNRIKYCKYFFILIGSISDFVQKFLSFYFVEYFENNFWIFNIFFFSVFSYFILKTKLYNTNISVLYR